MGSSVQRGRSSDGMGSVICVPMFTCLSVIDLCVVVVDSSRLGNAGLCRLTESDTLPCLCFSAGLDSQVIIAGAVSRSTSEDELFGTRGTILQGY